MFKRAALLIGLLASCWPSATFANGRYPRADQLLVAPHDSTQMVLRATYGVLLSHDAGVSWQWVCEAGVGYTGDVDPALVLFEDATVAAGYARGLVLSRDDGCTWSAANVSKENFIDATLDSGDSSTALLLSRRLDTSHLVHIVSVNAAGDAPLSLGNAMGDDISPVTLEVAPSDPNRIYVTAIAADLTTVLVRSDDRGDTWQRFPIQVDETLPAYIAAVDPNNPDRLYLRLDGATSDVLLVSDDGGQTFNDAFTIDADMLGFALSPDGASVALGGPGAGLFVADASDLDFAASPAPFQDLSCLKWIDSALIACADEKTDGFTLGTSLDSGQSFTPLFHITNLTPLTCDVKSDVGGRCPMSWPSVAETLGVSVADTSSSSVSATGGGCGCALPRARRLGAGSVVGLLLLVGVALGRRRRL